MEQEGAKERNPGMISVRLSQSPIRVFSYSLVLVVLAVCLSGCSGCRSGAKDKDFVTPVYEEETDLGDGSAGAGTEGDPDLDARPMTPPREPSVEIPELKVVYFDFDKAELRPDAVAALNANAEWLNANADVVIQIEGHCDERGTREYNFSLGERRAKSVIQYLAQQGIDPERMYFISYGEDRPVALGHDEAAWSLNRRAEFKRFVN